MMGDPFCRDVVSEGFILWHVQLVRDFVCEGLSLKGHVCGESRLGGFGMWGSSLWGEASVLFRVCVRFAEGGPHEPKLCHEKFRDTPEKDGLRPRWRP